MRIRHVPSTTSALLLLFATVAYAKSPPSAFGDAYGRGASAADSDVDEDLAAPDARAAKRTRTERRVEPPRARARHKITLDGSDGGRDRELERDDP